MGAVDEPVTGVAAAVAVFLASVVLANLARGLARVAGSTHAPGPSPATRVSTRPGAIGNDGCPAG